MSASAARSAVPFWRTQESKGRRAPTGVHGVDFGERGVYDKRNALNELTGKEWVFFLNSIWIKAYPPVADQCGFDLRKIHPCPKPPFLMRDIIEFFTKRGQWVLDPFAGVGGTLLGASLCANPRRAVGIELNDAYIRAYNKVAREQKLTRQILKKGDSRKMLRFAAVANQQFDLILTDPPYGNMMTRPKNGHKRKLYGRSDPTPFSTSDKDLGNLDYRAFLSELKSIMATAVARLKPGGYMVVFCRDLQPSDAHDGLLHADVIRVLSEIDGVTYRGMRIWHDQAADLYPFGYPYAFVMNQMHQYVLVFRKKRK